jgi:hypothetical protein
MPLEDEGHTLQATTRMREAWLSLADGVFKNRANPSAARAQVTRRDGSIALPHALHCLGPAHPRNAESVNLRYFTALSLEVAIEVLGMTTRAAVPDGEIARARPHPEIGTN